eukprot:5896006-Amphidinium_carterae.1
MRGVATTPNTVLELFSCTLFRQVVGSASLRFVQDTYDASRTALARPWFSSFGFADMASWMLVVTVASPQHCANRDQKPSAQRPSSSTQTMVCDALGHVSLAGVSKNLPPSP